jgi:hypothetical protein
VPYHKSRKAPEKFLVRRSSIAELRFSSANRLPGATPLLPLAGTLNRTNQNNHS